MYQDGWTARAASVFPRFARTLFLLAFLLAAASVPPAAARPWEGEPFAAEPAELLAAAAQTPGGERGVVILFSEARYRYDESGRRTAVRRTVYRILNATADESWSNMEVPWLPWHQERPELRARVITPDGKVHLLDPATITEAAATQEPTLFDDSRILRAPLPAASPGAVVEKQVTVRDTAPFFDRGTVSYHPVQSWVPVLHSRLVLEAPPAVPLRFAARQLPAGAPRDESAEGLRRLTFEYRDLPVFDTLEPGLPPDQPRYSHVAFSTGASWEDVARRYSELVDAAVASSGSGGAAELTAFLRAAGGPAGSQRETIDRLLARLGTEIRYTAVELGEGSIVPRTPAETLQRKFGDCKDKAVLLTALLRSLDVPAYVALLRAGEDEADVEESLPGMGAFNHAIVFVPATPPIWIDPTDRYARSGQLPAADQGRLALIASPTAKGLVRTPEATAADNREIEIREVHLADLGPARVVETTEVHGVKEAEMRGNYATADPADLREVLTSYVSSAYLAEDLTKLDFSNPDDLSQPFRLHLEIEKAPRGTTELQTAGFALLASGVVGRLPAEFAPDEEGGEPEPRKNDYFFTRPLSFEMRHRILPPPGFRPQPLPPARTRRFGPAVLSEDYAAAPDGVVTATLRLEVGQRRLTPQEFEALRAGVREVLEEDAVLVLFEQVGEAHLAAGEVREALAEFRRLAAQTPDKALPHSRVALALLAGGLGEAALAEARRAVALEPTSATAHSTLGWVLQHDELGRRFGQGSDRAAAIAAYRKAKELDPHDTTVRADLAILLEHDGQGERYARGADLTAAIEEYKALRADLDDTSMSQHLAVALMRAERFAEMKEAVAQVEDEEARTLLRLVAMAATDGAEATLREAERLFPDPAGRLAALEETVTDLIRVRRYPEAAALLERASRKSPNAARTLARVELLRKVRRHEEITVSGTGPAAVVRRLLLRMSDRADDARQAAQLFSRDFLSDLTSDEEDFIRSFNQGFELGRRSTEEELDLPADTLRDFLLGGFREAVSGDDALGHRVELTETMSGVRLNFYVIREGGELRIAALGTIPETLALEALRRLDGGDLRAARQWLDWAHAELPASGGGDPFATPPFVVLWTRGAEATAEEARCAAAALLAGSVEAGLAAKSLPLLLTCREAAPEGARRTSLDLALARAYGTEGRFAEQADVLRRLAAAAPASPEAAALFQSSLVELGRWPELRAFAQSRLDAYPGDAAALRGLYKAAQGHGALDEAARALEQILDAGEGEPQDFNNRAWLELFRGPVTERTLEHGQRAATLSEFQSYPPLHTLAVLYAETGKAAEAYQLLLQALQQKEDTAPGANDWYVLGRLAEHYGVAEAARGYYGRVTAPPGQEQHPTSTYQLAKRRLAALAPAAGPVAKR